MAGFICDTSCPGEGHPQPCQCPVGVCRAGTARECWGVWAGPGVTMGCVPGLCLCHPWLQRGIPGVAPASGRAQDTPCPGLLPPQAPAWGRLLWLPPFLQRCHSIPGPFEASPGASRGWLRKPRTPPGPWGVWGKWGRAGAAGPVTSLSFPLQAPSV